MKPVICGIPASTSTFPGGVCVRRPGHREPGLFCESNPARARVRDAYEARTPDFDAAAEDVVFTTILTGIEQHEGCGQACRHRWDEQDHAARLAHFVMSNLREAGYEVQMPCDPSRTGP